MELLGGKMVETSGSETISTRLQRVAKLAKEMPRQALTTLAHHLDVELLLEAYRLTRKDGAVGVDGQTASEYAENLEENLQNLLERAKSGAYRAPPLRRVRIPKAGGKTRPIGIPTFEDKVLQRAVAMVLGAVYEQDFRECSYGFRPGRSAHQALQELWEVVMSRWSRHVGARVFTNGKRGGKHPSGNSTSVSAARNRFAASRYSATLACRASYISRKSSRSNYVRT